jgi:glycosyltransferase involved in cell wall biosynthesis
MFPSVHILGSVHFGGAEQFYIQLLRALNGSGKAVVAINRGRSPVAHALQRDGVDQMHLPLAGGLDLWSAWRIRRIATHLQPCIVQTYLGLATGLTRLALKSHAVHVARVGGFYKLDGYRHAHAWVGSTRGICDHLVKSGLPPDRVYQIGNLVPDPDLPDEEERRALRQNQGIAEGTFVVFARGRLVEDKGFDDLLRAFAQLPPELNGRPLLLAIAGEGPLEERLRNLTTELQLWDRVQWLGNLQEVRDYFALSDLFVCPSREDPLGNIILDAWSYGLPVVSTATEGARELIEDEISGLLAEPGNSLSLAGRLDAAITASRMARMGLAEAGSSILARRFSREAVANAYLTLYDKLLAERGI